jgi:uncharacterized protein (DUF1778 family)
MSDSQDNTIKVTVTPEVKTWLTEEAASQMRSISNLAAFLLTQAMQAAQQPEQAPEPPSPNVTPVT